MATSAMHATMERARASKSRPCLHKDSTKQHAAEQAARTEAEPQAPPGHPSFWSHETLANYLEQVNVPEDVLKAVVADKVRGSYVVEIFTR